MLADCFNDRQADALVTRHRFGEHGCFFQFQAHIKPDHDQHGAEQKRDSPAPRTELFVIQGHCQRQKQAIGRQKADRRPQLRKHAKPGALAFGGIFSRQQGRAAPFSAQAKPLAEAQHAQQNRRPGPDGGVARQYADQRGADAHQQQRCNQRRLAADPVAEVTKQRRPQWACEKGDAKGQK